MHKLIVYFSTFTIILIITGSLSDPGFVTSDSTESKGLIKSITCSECKLKTKELVRHCKACKSCVPLPSFHCSFIGNCISPANRLHFYAGLLTGHILLIFLTGMFTWMMLWAVRIWPTVGLSMTVILECLLIVYSASMPSLKPLEAQ
mmetsp:Transcript_21739/g.39661  ORF Transcript_21739/g.39661 Transcript_21739/m.39661 type:complete len:147 (+) Transcript_21739:130-570(+)